jgi:hypothetical protein
MTRVNNPALLVASGLSAPPKQSTGAYSRRSAPKLDTALRFNADPVIHRPTNPLFTAEVTLGGLDGNVAEEELNLFQLPAGNMAQLGARAPLMPHAA